MDLAEAKQLDYLNYEENIQEFTFASTVELTVTLELSLKVQIQKRVVYDTMTALGDVGGLAELTFTFCSVIIGFFTQKFFMASQIKTLFMFATSTGNQDKHEGGDRDTEGVQDEDVPPEIKSLEFSYFYTILSSLTCQKLPRKSRDKRKAIDLGRQRLEAQLDIVNIIRESRQLRTLLRVLLRGGEQKLIRF